MSEDKKSLIDLVPDSVDNAVKNITDKPTQNMGNTFADIWYLVFGGISQAAEKRKLKYSYALQEFEKELKEKISKIPEDKLIEPDIQIIAQALESSKFCIDKEELRNMFSSLISSSMNKDNFITPLMIKIVSSLSSTSAKILKYFYEHDEEINKHKLQKYLKLEDYDTNALEISLLELEHLNLIYAFNKKPASLSEDDIVNFLMNNYTCEYQNTDGTLSVLENTRLSSLGRKICNICLK